jgi:hypothetical protein
MVPTWPIFEKCSHLREKGGVLTKIWLRGKSLSHTVASRCGVLGAPLYPGGAIKSIYKYLKHKFIKKNGRFTGS